MNKSINRRDFIKQGGASAFSLAFLPTIVRKTAPSDRLRIAHIGVGGMGNNHIKWFAALPEVEIAALCDVDGEHLNSSLKNLETHKPNS